MMVMMKLNSSIAQLFFPLLFCMMMLAPWWLNNVAVNGFIISPATTRSQTFPRCRTTEHKAQQNHHTHYDASKESTTRHDNNNHGTVLEQVWNQVTSSTLAFSLATLVALSSISSIAANAADYSGKDISGQDFSNQQETLVGKDFSKVMASKANFRNANLQGANFQNANLVKADFTGANLQQVNFQDAVLDGAVMKDVIASKTVWGPTILDVADFENADLTDSLWPS